MTRLLVRTLSTAAVMLGLAGCQDQAGRYPARAYAPIPGETLSLMRAKGTDRNAPVLLRAYKKESEIELWKQTSSGDYVHVKTYPICRWSGQLGPKTKEGDRQVPEGFYAVTASQMNPNSAYWLSFNVGYPNPFERALGRNGGDIMVHGTCSSRGCFAMTNEQIEEIYAVMREAFNGGQKGVQFQSYPFRMTAENLAKFRHDPNIAYWKNLKQGSDHFEVTKREPQVAWCGNRYVFNASADNGRLEPTTACPSLKTDPVIAQAVAAKAREDDAKVAELVQKGAPAIRVQYADGSQHMSFRTGRYFASNATDERFVGVEGRGGAIRTASLGDVSRPEALDTAEEIVVDETGRPKAKAAPAAIVATEAKPASVAGSAPTARSYAEATGTTAVKPAGALSALTAIFVSDKAAPGSVDTSAAPPAAAENLASGAAPALPAVSTANKSSPNGTPFYKRLLGFGASEPEQAEADIAPSSSPPVPAAVPLPPRRAADLSAPPRQSAVSAPIRARIAALPGPVQPSEKAEAKQSDSE